MPQTHIDDTLPIEHITIGCSHTRGVVVKCRFRWPEVVYEETNTFFHYRHFSKVAAGLFYVAEKLGRKIEKGIVDPNKVKYLVIQKPEALRYPWFCTRKQYSSLEVNRSKSIKNFLELSEEEKQSTAEMIYEKEKDILKQVREWFPETTKMAYYHYWLDYGSNTTFRAPLGEVNKRLGEYCSTIGIENWDMIIDPSTVHGAMTKRGEWILDPKKMSDNDWTASKNDWHPGPATHRAIADKVKSWIGSS